MKYSTCHPDRQHFGHGLCNTCWQRERYRANPEPRKAMRRAYYAEHRAAEQRRASLRYHRAHPGASFYGPISVPYGSGLRKPRPRAVGAENNPSSRYYVRPPAPLMVKESDRDWWKLTDKERAHFK
jgi:hypothetical protein